jgi:hypothetical protein
MTNLSSTFEEDAPPPSSAGYAWIRRGNVYGWLINEYTISLNFVCPVLTMTEVLDSERVRDALLPDTPFHCLIENTGTRQTDPKTRRYPPSAYARKIALVYGSPVGRMLGNAYLRLMPSNLPIRLFRDREKAFVWLEQGEPPQS